MMGTIYNPNLGSSQKFIPAHNECMQNNLRKIRESLGLSQDVAAKRLGTTRSQYVKLERGERRLSDVWIERAASGFEVPAAAIISDYSEGGSTPLPAVSVFNLAEAMFDKCSEKNLTASEFATAFQAAYVAYSESKFSSEIETIVDTVLKDYDNTDDNLFQTVLTTLRSVLSEQGKELPLDKFMTLALQFYAEEERRRKLSS